MVESDDPLPALWSWTSCRQDDLSRDGAPSRTGFREGRTFSGSWRTRPAKRAFKQCPSTDDST